MDWFRNLILAFQLIPSFLNVTLELLGRGMSDLVNTITVTEMVKGRRGDKKINSASIPFPCSESVAILICVPSRNFSLDGQQGWGVCHG